MHSSDIELSPGSQPGGLNNRTVEPPAGSVNVDEILFDEFKAADTLIIQTRNSAYTFSVTGADGRRGTLTGGALDGHVADANLLKVGSNKLKVGSRAVFLIESSGCVRRLSTSTIIRLYYEKCDTGCQKHSESED